MLPLFRPELFGDNPAEALNRLAGVTQKFVANMDRETVRASARKDSLSTGVRWFANPGACAFCALMSAHSVKTEDPHWHDNCKCTAVPGWDDAPVPDAEYMAEYDRAATRARDVLMNAQYKHPDYSKYPSHRAFLRAHPDLSIKTKNLTRVMRERFGFDH